MSGSQIWVVKERFPNILVELTVDLSVNLKKILFSHSIDLAFQSGPFERQISGLEDLGTYPWIRVASSELALLNRGQLSTEDLFQFPVAGLVRALHG